MDKNNNKGLRSRGVRRVEETNIGVYLWATADNKLVSDEEGRFLSIPATKGDQERIRKIREAAEHYGIEGGRPVFLAGNRQVTDEEYEEQKSRQAFGLVPDPLDIGAIKDEERRLRKYGKSG